MTGRWLSATAVVVFAAAALAFVLIGGGGSAENEGQGPAPSRLLEPDGFADTIEAPRVVTINVHVPDEGSIQGTDETIPFDRIKAMRAKLPAPGTPLALYCRSGTMSAIAARTLADLGYTTITELDGGMDAWAQSGRPLLPPG